MPSSLTCADASRPRCARGQEPAPAQMALTHKRPPRHVTPQPPQLLASVIVLTQASPHAVSSPVHIRPQCPATHD